MSRPRTPDVAKAAYILRQSFTHALLALAYRPEYIQPLREEIESVIAEEGWTKVAMTRMRKLDSFLKENQRVTGVGAREPSIVWSGIKLTTKLAQSRCHAWP